MARLLWRDSFWDGKRKPLLIALGMSSVMLILLFLCNLSYIYGSLFHSGHRVHALNILAVDFDGGVIGQSLKGAYTALEADSFPGLQFHTVDEYPTINDVRNAVCKGHFWGAVVSQPGASDRLAAALEGGTAATDYNSSDTLTYIWNEAHYPTIQIGDISGNLETLIGASTSVYHVLNGTGALSVLNTSSSAAIMAYGNPISSSNINIMVTEQPERALYNTVTIVLPIIQQFFFLMALNSISNQFHIYGRLRSSRIGLMRLAISFTYTFLASLTVTGYIWAFRESWTLNSNQFALVWMAYWLFMHINFAVLDAFTAFIPMSFLSFFVLTWAIINVTATIYPFELSAGFYRWAYALPAHEIYTILVQIESGGCNNRLYIALPILFVEWIVAVTVAILGSFHRNRAAEKELLKAEENQRVLDKYAKRNPSIELEPLQNNTNTTHLASFPVPFQNKLYSDERELLQSRQETV